MGTSSLTLATLASTTGALWQGSTPILIAAFTMAVVFFITFAFVQTFKKSARRTLR